VTTARRLAGLSEEDRGRVQAKGRVAGSALRVHGALQARPVTNLSEVAAKTGLSFPAATAGMGVLTGLGIATELTGRKRDRVFAYDRYLAVLQEGTEPL
jgi:Fic family protein